MLEADALERLRELAVQASAETVEIGDRTYAVGDLSPVRDPEPTPVGLYTLSGLVDFVKANVDGLDYERTFLHVVDPRTVRLRAKVSSTWAQRATLAEAKFSREVFPFGKYLATFEMTTRLQAEFTPAGDRGDVLRVLGTIKDEEVRTQEDDGVTQKVAASTGVHLADNVDVPNPVRLAPHRTFPEVEQPESPFVLRVQKGRGGIEAALFEADGGAWKNEAVKRIADWLDSNLTAPEIIA